MVDVEVTLNGSLNDVVDVTLTQPVEVVMLPVGPRGRDADQTRQVWEDFAPISGAMEIEVDGNPAYAILYINGLLQRSDSFTLSNSVVHIPASLNVVEGDLLQIMLF